MLLLVYFLSLTCVASATQTFSQQPADIATNLGTSQVTLPCVVAEKTGELFWTKDNLPLGSDTDTALPGLPRYAIVGDTAAGAFNLQITDVVLDDDGVFRCQVTPSATDPQLQSTPARLTVQRPPGAVNLAGSPSMSVVVDVEVGITCTANGANPAATIAWFRDGEAVEGAEYTSEQAANDPSGKLWDASSVLTLTPVLNDHGVVYECRASNPAIEAPVTASLTLDVQHAPIVAVETIPEEVREETTTICRCVVDANPRSVTYLWTKNGETLAGAESNQVELLVTKEDHEATIECSASNSKGTTSANMKLNVLYGPRLVEIPESISVDEGTPAQMTCIGDGNPTPTTKWTRLGSRATLSTMQRLQFDSVRGSDVGVYVCTVTVPGFDPIQSIGRLDINAVPIIISEPVQKAKRDSTAVLECHTDTKPDPYLIMWSWKDGELETGTDGRFSAEQIEAKGGGISSYLRIEKVQKEDFDDYNCTIWNDVGIQSKIITLEQQDMDLIIYIIIGVVAASGFIFIMTIITMAYCRRRFRQKKVPDEDAGKEVIPVEIIPQVMSLKDALNRDKKKKDGDKDDVADGNRSDESRPRYAMPHEFVNRDRRNSWDDPQYSRRYSNEYMEPHDFDRRPSPLWNDGYDDRDAPYEKDEDPYARREIPYNKFDEDDIPEPIFRDRSVRSRRSDRDDYVDPRDFSDAPYDRYESERDNDEYHDRYSYENNFDKESEVSYNSKDRLATHV